ncbi:hypothetical protein [Alkalinema sp. FACHB-956]|uniref:hypothetical protein n=1 Tax=Alkalinema sp. FACHB-956 TaxID=2692768 RepID=UPI00168A2594|nr:hypothetical protein [Alkalinema sp. FACHB-956]MBD2328475.1 hypothetical protein [Alkalinema sp. FACHB-956]
MEQGQLRIYQLQDGKYQAVQTSLHFPNFPIAAVLPQFLDRCAQEVRRQALKAFRQWVQQQAPEVD